MITNYETLFFFSSLLFFTLPAQPNSQETLASKNTTRQKADGRTNDDGEPARQMKYWFSLDRILIFLFPLTPFFPPFLLLVPSMFDQTIHTSLFLADDLSLAVVYWRYNDFSSIGIQPSKPRCVCLCGGGAKGDFKAFPLARNGLSLSRDRQRMENGERRREREETFNKESEIDDDDDGFTCMCGNSSNQTPFGVSSKQGFGGACCLIYSPPQTQL